MPAGRSGNQPSYFDEVGNTVKVLGAFAAAGASGVVYLLSLPKACIMTNLNHGDAKEFPVIGALVLGAALGVVMWKGQQKNPTLRYATAFALALIVFGVVFASLMGCTCKAPAEAWFNGMTGGRGLAALCLADH